MKCPGQDTQYWDNNAIFETKCPECGHTLEFFKDDATRRCTNCQKKIVNPKMDFGCASYCKFAGQCLGSLPEDFIGVRDDLLKDRVAVEVKRYLKKDFRRIGHSVRMADFAEKIEKKEKANLPVLLCSAYFYNIVNNTTQGEQESSTKEDSLKKSELIRTIMEKLGAKEEMISDVIRIINSDFDTRTEDIPENNIIHDAHILAIMDNCKKKAKADKAKADNDMNSFSELEQQLRTSGGRELAKILIDD